MWSVLGAVEHMNLDGFYGAYRANGQGRAAYDPQMMRRIAAVFVVRRGQVFAPDRAGPTVDYGRAHAPAGRAGSTRSCAVCWPPITAGRSTAKRRHIEPVFGQIKANRRIDRFQRRGRAAVRSEWRLIAAEAGLALIGTDTTAAAAALALAATDPSGSYALSAHRWCGYSLAYAGRMRDAIASFDRALALAGDDVELDRHLSGTRDF